ncbi:DNA-protecting protein DprA [Edaphovirga cremea]|uniref:DNA-protecting protein DprA n=1 Tax=Edaphovirga cremea TaxID=2267246 RepID=UPI00398A4565
MEAVEVWLRLRMVKGLGVKRSVKIATKLLLSSSGDAKELFSQGMNNAEIHAFLHPNQSQLDVALTWLQTPQNHLITFLDPDYPALLKHIPSPPLMLFVSGDTRLLNSQQIAMVGSRQYSDYGQHWGQYFSTGVVSAGYTLTSGLALGIDAICHRAALAAQGKTIAVLGSGLMKIHPSSHRGLAARILEQHGALVSEFLPTEPPLPAHFPRRNRIISGLSQGVVIVEAGLRSGSLITARCALEQGRDVFALPGPLGCPTSEGTHWLIQQGAYLVTRPEDVIEQLAGGLEWLSLTKGEDSVVSRPNAPSIQQELNISAEDCEVELPFADVLANVGYEVTPVDVVAERAGQPVPEVVIKLLDLELAGWIAAVPGGYVRIRRACHVRRTNVLV